MQWGIAKHLLKKWSLRVWQSTSWPSKLIPLTIWNSWEKMSSRSLRMRRPREFISISNPVDYAAHKSAFKKQIFNDIKIWRMSLTFQINGADFMYSKWLQQSAVSEKLNSIIDTIQNKRLLFVTVVAKVRPLKSESQILLAHSSILQFHLIWQFPSSERNPLIHVNVFLESVLLQGLYRVSTISYNNASFQNLTTP